MLCSVLKHIGSGRTRKKCRGKHDTQSSIQTKPQPWLLHLCYDKDFIHFSPIASLANIFKPHFIFQASKSSVNVHLYSRKTCICILVKHKNCSNNFIGNETTAVNDKLGRFVRSLTKLIQDKREIWSDFSKILVRFSVYIVCPSVLSWSNL